MRRERELPRERKKKKKTYKCISCDREISKEEYEAHDGMCQECFEIEIDEMDFEDDYGP